MLALRTSRPLLPSHPALPLSSSAIAAITITLPYSVILDSSTGDLTAFRAATSHVISP